MRPALTTLLLSWLFTALGLVVAAPASACSCVPRTTQEHFERADAVFTGRLVSREEPGGTVVSSADPALHVFAVDTVHKGTPAAEQEVLSPASSATCGLDLAGEGPFVVFATRSTDLGGTRFATPADDQYASLLCDGSGPVTPQLAAELDALTAPHPPSSAPRPSLPTAESPSDDAQPMTAEPGPLLVVLAAVTVLSAAGLLVRRTVRSRRE